MTNPRESLEDRVAQLESTLHRQTAEITRLRRRRVSRGAIYVLAVVVTLGLGTYGTASALSGSNTVYTDDIVDQQVYGKDVRDGTLHGADVADNSLTGNDIAESTLKLPIAWKAIPPPAAASASCQAGDFHGDGAAFGQGLLIPKAGKDASGIVHLAGVMSLAWSGPDLATRFYCKRVGQLPSGLRPPAAVIAPVVCRGNNGNAVWSVAGRVTIYTDGWIELEQPSSPGCAPVYSEWVSLSGVEFPAA